MSDPADHDANRRPDGAQTEAKSPEATICLDQFLKTCGVATGGQAKQLIQGGEVLVNQEVETRRRRKLRVGDEVQLFDDIFVVAWNED
jgi:ribosome-associated protein